MYSRWLQYNLKEKLDWPYVHILFGARQTGKSTILKSLMPENSRILDFSNLSERTRYLQKPETLIEECLAIPKENVPQFVFIDEAQTVPLIFDCVQHLYDKDKNRWRFVMCGSSARKLRRTGANLLPGRSIIHYLYPLTLAEILHLGGDNESLVLPFAWPEKVRGINRFPQMDLLKMLTFGSLPGIATADEAAKSDVLKTYSSIFIEEEIRREAMLKDMGVFIRFITLAAAESGSIINFSSISREIGLSVPTIKSYYQILEDMFIGFSVPAFTKSPRKNILSTPKFIFFDIGVRNAATGMNLTIQEILANPGPVFEQWVGMELWKRIKYLGEGALYYQRSKAGYEIDFIVESKGNTIPVEVKWTEKPDFHDAKHLLTFIGENRNCEEGFVVCRCPRPMQIHEKVKAIPWFML
jgi:predicted AAA+ superfamily ATPase